MCIREYEISLLQYIYMFIKDVTCVYNCFFKKNK